MSSCEYGLEASAASAIPSEPSATPGPFQVLPKTCMTEQRGESADTYITQLRAFIKEHLPTVVKEEMLVEIVYGLLDGRIQKLVSRENVLSLDNLQDKARCVEDALEGVAQSFSRVDGDALRAFSRRTGTQMTVPLYMTRRERRVVQQRNADNNK